MKYLKSYNESVRSLMKRKSDKDILNSCEGKTSEEKLLLGAENGILALVKNAVENSADINVKTEYGNTALIYASRFGYLDIVKYLVENGANINAKNRWDSTALMRASNNVHIEIVKVLLDAGADVTLTDYDWKIVNKHTELIELLKKYMKTNESVRSFMRPKSDKELIDAIEHLTPVAKFYAGIEYGLVSVVKDGIKNGMDIHFNNDMPLRIACQNNQVNIVQILLDAGADVHAEEDRSFRVASLRGHTETVKVLLDASADVHALNDCALRYASDNGHIEVVKLLLNAGADVHAEEDRALKNAIEKGHIEIVKLLKKHMGINESVRSFMKAKTKEEIIDELEDMEPRERVESILDEYVKSINQGDESIWTQEEIDGMLYVIFDTYDAIYDNEETIEALYYYIDASKKIQQEIKDKLSILSAYQQIYYVHNLQKLRGLYTDIEWSNLKKNAKGENQED